MEIWAYLDDSGHEDDRWDLFLAVGGATATLDLWDKVDHRWVSALEQAGLKAFHVRDFEHFRKTKPEKANPLIEELTKIIYECLHPVIAWGNQRAYDAALRPPPKEPNQKRALDFAVEWCFERLISRASTNDVVHIVFSKTPKYMGRVAEIHSAIKKKRQLGKRLGDITIDHAPKNDIRLQVADLVISGFTKGMKHNDLPLEWYDTFLARLWAKSHRQGDLRYFPFTELVEWKSILDEP